MDLALWAAFFLVNNYRSGLDQKTRDIYTDLRALIENAMYGGQDIGRTLAALAGASQGDTNFDVLTYQIRDAMHKNREFAHAVWDILRRSDPMRMPDGPWVDSVNTEATVQGVPVSQVQQTKRVIFILQMVAIAVLLLCLVGMCASVLLGS